MNDNIDRGASPARPSRRGGRGLPRVVRRAGPGTAPRHYRPDGGHHVAGSGHYSHPPPAAIHARPADEQTPDPEAARAIEILSHELRSPITTINLGTKVLRHGDRRVAGPVREEVIEALEAEAERLYRLIEDLLAVARHEGGGAPLPVGPLLLQRWLPPVVASEAAAHPGVLVRVLVPPSLPAVLADDGGLAQVVRNLIANAVRFAPPTMPIELVVEQDGDHALLRVLDRGPGIDPDEADHLFEPFYRSPRTASAPGGAGLGLAAARRLLRAMGGTITAQGRPDGGAELAVRLPLLAPEDEADEPPTAGTGSEDARPTTPRAS